MKKHRLSFWVAECEEFKTMGKTYTNLSLDEAVNIYNKLISVPVKKCMGPGLGFTVDKGTEDETTLTLLSGQFIFSSMTKSYLDEFDKITGYIKEHISDAEIYEV